MNIHSIDAAPAALIDIGDVPILASDAQALAAAQTFAERIRPGAAERDASRIRPWEEIRALRASGLLGITVPIEYGGPGIKIRTLVDVFRIIAAADPAIGQIPQNHFSSLENIRMLGTPEQKNFFYGEIRRGALFGNGLSERGTAGGQRHLKTRLRRETTSGWSLQGRKYYCTGALFAQWVPVTALDEEDRAHVAYVRRDAPGVAVLDDWDSMGQRGTASGSVILTKVTVSDEHVVATWRRDTGPSTRLPLGQIMHAAVDIGIAEEALADTIVYIRTRSRPWHGANLERAGDDPHTIRRIGELTVRMEAARALLMHAADSFDVILAAPLENETVIRLAILVAAAKAAASSVAVQVSNDLFALAGTSSADEKWNLHRHWRNARTHTLHDPEVWKYYYIGDWVLNGRVPPHQALII